MESLITSVVPATGTYCLTTINAGKVRQKFFADANELESTGIAASAYGDNAYFAMASFNDGSARTQENVAEIKAFWLDIDCKGKSPAKDYANKDDALAALSSFCKMFSMPKPTVVDSGGGWHVYWILDEAIPLATWQPVANQLKAACLNNGLRIDPACTADSARILRIPGTLNYRYDPPAPVSILMEGPVTTLDELRAPLQEAFKSVTASAASANPAKTQSKQLTKVQKALQKTNYPPSSFKKIMTKCMAGTGCPQLAYAVENQATVDEPVWRGALSVANECTDREIAIHFVGSQHPEYTVENTLEKIRGLVGPYTCAKFEENNPGGCAGCPNKGKVGSPIQLGVEVAEVTTPVTLPPPQELVPNVESDFISSQPTLAAFYIDRNTHDMPVPPTPFIWGQQGGLYKRTKMPDDTFDDILVYEHALYAHTRLYDPDQGQMIACRLHLPRDAVRDFNIPLSHFGSKDKLREALCSRGVAANDATLTSLGHFMISSVQALQRAQPEETARTQMGWQTDGSFVVGDREYTKGKIKHCPPSVATAQYQPYFTVVGELDEWKSVLQAYDARAQYLYKFVFLALISSVFNPAMQQTGTLISLISDASGKGKTTLYKVCNSFWGHPDKFMTFPHDTFNALANRIGVLQNISVTCDEFTNKMAEALSELAYMVSQGRGKARLQGSANVERINNTTWNMNVGLSANAALGDKISSLKASPDGERMRLIEFDVRDVPMMEKELADPLFKKIYKNYGLAGHLLASWLVEAPETHTAMLMDMQKAVDKAFGFTTKERNWSNTYTAAFEMGYVLKQLGLIDWDINELMQDMKPTTEDMRDEVQASGTNHDGLLSEFLTEFHSNVLVVNALPDAAGLYREAKNRNITRIKARYEPDTHKLFIAVRDIREYCVKRQFSYNSLVTLTNATVVDAKRMASGSGVVAGGVRALMFDTRVNGIDMGAWVDHEGQDAPHD